MNNNLTPRFRLIVTGLVTLLIWLHLLWDYFNGGVPSHHLLHRADMPAISNWWGGISLPLLTWFLLYRIKNRIEKNNQSRGFDKLNSIFYGFLGTFIFGILLSYFFTIGSDIPGYMMIGLFVISFLIPIYRSEFFLGFVIGMGYTFGANLPIGIGIVLWIIFTVNHKFVRAGFLALVRKISPKSV